MCHRGRMCAGGTCRSRLGCWILATLLVAHCCANSVEGLQSFVVDVIPGQLDQVAAVYDQLGYEIQQRNDRYSFLVVGQPPTSAAVAASSVAQGPSHSSRVPGWVKYGAQQQAKDAAGEVVPRNTTTNGLDYNQASYSLQATPQVSAAAVSAAAQTAAQLASVNGVQHVQQNSVMYLLDRHNTRSKSHIQRHLQQTTAQSPQPKTYASEPVSCPAVTNTFPDYNLGRIEEGVPYGIHMVEADSETMIQISKDHKHKVMWCVIDTGLDVTNPDFNTATTTGCTPGATRGDGTSHNCDYAWFEDRDGHGTHTSGTIAALRNGRAVVGVSAEGANIYNYNIFGPSSKFMYTDLLRAWDDCINELDWRKSSTATFDMKMVVSMSVGGPGDVRVVAEALSQITAARRDVLFVAAAGNSGDDTVSFPAGDSNVVSVGAVDWLGYRASFSAYNADVEWSAPGVLTLSTVPLWAASQTSYNLQTNLVLNPYVPPATAPDILDNPKILMMGGSSQGEVGGQLVDCGLGATTCSNATGKICLLQRGGSNLFFCSKVANCLAGGGIGTIMYTRDDQPACQQLSGVTLDSPDCTTPAQGWPVVLTASKSQGYWLREKAAEGVTVTLRAMPDGDGPALNYLSGTSMATPTAAGVAGLLWSYHSNCTAADLRAAISASATDVSTKGRDEYYGYGIVNATAAHNYLLQNPCVPAAPPPPPTPVNCSGSWDWSECDKPCGGGQQIGTYRVFKQPVNGGEACPATAGTNETRACNMNVCLQAADDMIIVTSGRWTAVPLLANDAGDGMSVAWASNPDNGGSVKVGQASKELAKVEPLLGSVSGNNVVYYLSKPGYIGTDRFSYTVTDSAGGQKNATVTVQVTTGSCKPNSCTGGSCSTATGMCICNLPGMVPTFVRHPVVASRAVTPKVPACRYKFTPIQPLGSNLGVKAKQSAKIPFAFIIGSDGKCLENQQVIRSVRFVDFPGCAAVSDMTELGDSGLDVGMMGCSGGRYTYVVKVSKPVGCYRMVMQFVDGRALATPFRVVS